MSSSPRRPRRSYAIGFFHFRRNKYIQEAREEGLCIKKNLNVNDYSRVGYIITAQYARREEIALKKSSSYKMRVPLNELLEYPNAYLSRDILSQTGTTVLIPSKIPISKFVEGLENPGRIVEALERMGIQKIDIEIPNEIDGAEVMERLLELDPSVVLLDNELTRKAQATMSDIFEKATVDKKYNIPKKDVEDLGVSLSKEIAGISQIALSLISSDEDSYSKGHAINVSLLSGYIAKKLAEAGKAGPELRDKAVLAGLLFDIGKAAIPREVMQKKSTLSHKETAIVRNHVQESIKMCREAGIDDKEILDGIASHHERYDGSGYPKGLVGARIPLLGRVLAVADTFDAMTSYRFYRNAVSSKIAFNFITSANETKFDPDICKIFIAGMGVYPPGSAVLLSDGRVATVVAMTSGNLLQPKVAIADQDEKTPLIVDLAAEKLFIKRSLDLPQRDEIKIDGFKL